MDCPRCKLPLTPVSSIITACLCDQCEGVWLSRDTLEECLKLPLEYLRNSPFWVTLEADHPEVSLEPLISCPVCAIEMQRYPYDKKSQVIVDACKEHGIWLDDGELSKILEYREHSHQLVPPAATGHGRVQGVAGGVWHNLAHWFGKLKPAHR